MADEHVENVEFLFSDIAESIDYIYSKNCTFKSYNTKTQDHVTGPFP